jgi:monosaccharide-transporting ATPase
MTWGTGREPIAGTGPEATPPRLATNPSAFDGPVLSVRNLSKHFGVTVALDRVDLDVRPGEIVGLMGENGAGKSTLVGVLSGVLPPNAGEILIDGHRQAFGNAHDAQARGIATVYQHLALARHLDVAENLFLGRQGPMWNVVRPGQLHRRAASVLADLGWNIDVRKRVGTLPTSDQQLVEVARAIASHARVLLLDEPTSSLAPNDVAALVSRVRALAKGGIAVIFVSHQLDEVFNLVDSFAVLRDGQVVLRCRKDETDRATVVRAMLGATKATNPIMGHPQPAGVRPSPTSESVFEAQSISRTPAFRDVSFLLNPGEVLALTGLRGCGAVEVAAGLFNQKGLNGRLMCFGQKGPLSTAQLIRSGVGFVPADRGEGLFPDLSLRENLNLAGRVAGVRSVQTIDAVIAKLAIRARDAAVPVRQLSGGNQQKVLIGRWLVTQVRALILVEPTRGVDIGVRADIHRLIRELAGDGLGVLLASLDTEEIEYVADRVLVMHDGTVSLELGRPFSANDVLEAVARVASTGTQEA